MSGDEPFIPDLGPNQTVRSGRHGSYVVTREQIVAAYEHMRDHPVPVTAGHDPTKVPIGRTVAPELQELPDGELALAHDVELFDGYVPDVPIYSQSQAAAWDAGHPARATAGPITLSSDRRSYDEVRLQALADAVETGEAAIGTDLVRFSQLPDPILFVGLGTAGAAASWFAKGFFSKLGEGVGQVLGEEVGEDARAAYRRFKAAFRQTVATAEPQDREPITLLTIDVLRDGLPPVRVEGSYRGNDDGLDAFLDAGEELLAFATALIPHFRDPDGLRRLHFIFDGQAWRFHYGLDREARLAMIRVVSDAEYATLVQRAAASRN